MSLNDNVVLGGKKKKKKVWANLISRDDTVRLGEKGQLLLSIQQQDPRPDNV